MRGLRAIIARDVTLAFRAGGGSLPAVAFFAVITVLFALAAGPDLTLMSKIAAPIIWTGALFATQISLDQIYRADREDGSLDVIVTTSGELALTAAAKAAAHWLSTGLPLILATPVLAILLNLESEAYLPLLLSLLIGTPGLSLIGSFAAALTVALPRANLLISIIVSPLYIPILIFGAGAAAAGAAGAPQYAANLSLLGAATLFTAVIAPIASAAALRSNMD
ncbi:MAG: heme exporter protein CcmB [Parvularculaceae bacterium]|nr:heme exporter protein CcmB [Parvularculaceae bacterium]